MKLCKQYLLPTGSEERELLGVGSIHVAILLSCHYKNVLPTYCIGLNIVNDCCVVKLRNTSEALLGPVYSPWPSYTLRQYDSLGEYCGPHTASSVFLISFMCKCVFCSKKIDIYISYVHQL